MKETTEDEIVAEEAVKGEISGNMAIGNAAGVIWEFLDQKSEPVNLSTLKSEISVSSTLLMMGLGWLAREDKLAIEKTENSPSYRISLKR